MKNAIRVLFAALLPTLSLAADYAGDYYGSYAGCANCFGFESVLTIDVGGGYRSDNFEWKRRGSDGMETVEKWREIAMGVAETDIIFLACNHYLLRGDFDSAWFDNSGHQYYQVYENDSLTQDLRSKTKGQTYNLSGAVGYQFNFYCSRLNITPLVGYSYNYQRYKNHTYQDLLATPVTEVQYHNRYKYRWNGPWIGAAISGTPYLDLLIYFEYQFHWTKLLSDIHEYFPDTALAHIHTQMSWGNEYQVGVDYVFCDGWFMGVKFDYKQFWGNKPRYRSEADLKSIPLHDLWWNSYNVTLDIGYNF